MDPHTWNPRTGVCHACGLYLCEFIQFKAPCYPSVRGMVHAAHAELWLAGLQRHILERMDGDTNNM